MTEDQGNTVIALLQDMVQILRAIGEVLTTGMIYVHALCWLTLCVIFFAAVGRRSV